MSAEFYKIDLGKNYPEFIANLLTSLKDNYKRIVFISANKRPIRFIEKQISPEIALGVDFFTIDEFVQWIVTEYLNPAPTIQTKLFRQLYFLDLIKSTIGEKESLFGTDDARLLGWAKRLSSLFDEIDRQLLDERLADFQYIEAIEEAERILSRLKSLYAKYREDLKDFTYSGDSFRRAVEITKKDAFKDDFRGSLFIYSGIVYLSNSDLEIIKNISTIADIIYLSQTDLLKREKTKGKIGFSTFKVIDELEAKLKKAINAKTIYKGCEEEEKKVAKPETELSFYQFADTHTQAEAIFNILKKHKKIKKPDKLAVILPNQATLFPLLSFIDKDYNINITMGFPFLNTNIGMFVDSVFELALDLKNRGQKPQTANSKLLLKLLNSSIIGLFKDDIIQEAKEIKRELFEKGAGSYTFKNNSAIHFLISNFVNIDSLKALKEAFMGLIGRIDEKKLEGFELESQLLQLLQAQIIDAIDSLADRSIDLKFAYQLTKEILKDIEVPFEGYPLKGIQIMGMLEARSLSFDEVVVADVNEGVLPSADKIDPLLPEEIKVALGLTSFKQKEALVRYNFFRLIYSSRKAHIMYKVGSTGMEKFIKSRFAEQLILLEELKDKKPNICTPKISLKVAKDTANYIEKDEEAINYFNHLTLFSPTEIDAYLNCPYAHYLRYIKKIEPRVSLEDKFEANLLGSIIHKLLEEGFKEFKGKRLSKSDLEKIKKSILKRLDQIFKNPDEETRGFLERLSEFERAGLPIILKHRLSNYFLAITNSKDFKPFEVIETEYDKGAFEMELDSGVKATLWGKIDRIDKIGDTLRIVDYKAGMHSLKPKTTKIAQLNQKLKHDLFNDEQLKGVRDTAVSFQLAVYMLIASNMWKDKEITTELHYLGKTKAAEKGPTSKDIETYKDLLRYTLNHMKNSKYIYALPSDRCSFCPYNYFCKFGG
ncbi:PD-(D/E)XK nuclease family protein [Hippea sp. KM1]|uniref:PD-(D/E)XK nuclease family protein n=1 Tax=Hippea sp. KM1 TaxID=944481 RepID=UPI00046D810B|nr:PD-(D/E)XK nuclease family protein [Hippea sp. KM1]